MFFQRKIDLHSRTEMVHFLSEHFRYTNNDWYESTSYANKVKVYDIGLTTEQINLAFEIMSEDEKYWDRIKYPIDDFTREMNGSYTIISSGRSRGYLVLRESRYRPSKYRSYCLSCGQQNYRRVLTPLSPDEDIIMAEVFNSGGHMTVGQYLIQPEIAKIPLFDEHKSIIIANAKEKVKDHMLGNRCGLCGAEGKFGLVNYESIPQILGVINSPIDQNANFSDTDEWDMDALRNRVRLVSRFDKACDEIRSAFIDLLDNTKVIEKVITVPKTRNGIVRV